MALITIIEHVLMILQDHDKTEEEILWVGLGYKCGIRDPHREFPKKPGTSGNSHETSKQDE